METFAMDKAFYDIGAGEEFWESDMDPAMQEVLKLNSSGDLTVEWLLEKDLPGIIIHDKLMTDAALGTRPIKTEHSYSLSSDGDSLPDSPISNNKMDEFIEMDEDCLPTMTMTDACGNLKSEIIIKDEPQSETESQHSSCPPSPQHTFLSHNDNSVDKFFVEDFINPKSIIKNGNLMLTATNNIFNNQRIQMPKYNFKLEPTANFQLPPTPPSCSSSEESEDNQTVSQPASPNLRKINTRIMINHHTTTRQPIHTPLISSQPKGSTGTLILTEEEKRTLIAEGYPVPTRLPLTKAEEKSLKKIRRKIKNKISAQESRRKKKEYMDQLERKVEILVSENSDYRKKIETLEDSNNNLLSQLAKLQAIVAKTHPQLVQRQIK